MILRYGLPESYGRKSWRTTTRTTVDPLNNWKVAKCQAAAESADRAVEKNPFPLVLSAQRCATSSRNEMPFHKDFCGVRHFTTQNLLGTKLSEKLRPVSTDHLLKPG